MEHGTDMENAQLETRSVEHVEHCSCCGEPMTSVEVLESYLDQSLEQALEVCGALDVAYGSARQIVLLAKIADNLAQAASLTEVARAMTEGEANG